MKLRFGAYEDGRSAFFDLEILVDTRLLIQANSGGGKSYLIRKLLEASHGKVQQIVLDLEGEFATLREKFDYILAGKGGDIPTDVRTAELLARKVLELGTSIIIDLYELKQQDRKRYVRLFLEAVINAPKDLWHPCLIIVDEAHQFCPEKEEAESAGAVVDLLTRGRKRGFCGVLATQRLAKLNKDAAAECNNVLIGRTGLDVDMERANDLLGFTTKDQMLSLRELDPGQFFAYGPALSRKVARVKVDQVVTTHPKVGARGLTATPPPPPDKIKAVLAKLTDLPQEAQRELKDKESMIAEIRTLHAELRQARATQGQVSPDQIKEIEARAFAQGERTATQHFEKGTKALGSVVSRLKISLQEISKSAATAAGVEVPSIPAYTPRQAPAQVPRIEPPRPVAPFLNQSLRRSEDQLTLEGDDKPLREGAMKMLRAAAQFHPDPISRVQMGTLAGYSVNGGTFGTYFGELKRKDWIEEGGDSVRITEAGLSAAGPVDPLPTDSQQLIDMWAGKFRDGAAKILRFTCSKYPEWVTDEEIGQETEFSPAGGTYGTYIGELRRNQLIERESGRCRASPALFLEGVITR